MAEIFGYGDAHFLRVAPAVSLLNQPITGMGTSPTGKGYRPRRGDGGIFGYGDVKFYGSLPGIDVHVADVIGQRSDTDGKGLLDHAYGGQVYAFGDAHRLGNYVASPCDPIAAIFANPKKQGYRLVTRSGATLPFGTAPGGNLPTGTPMKCPPQNPKAEAAIAWVEARMEQCLRGAVRNGRRERGPHLRGVPHGACANWLARPDKHADWQNAPWVHSSFLNTSSAGHVAISLGNGYIVSTSIDNRIGVAPVGFLRNPLGWASAPW